MGIRIFLADDHQVLRDGLRAILSREPDIEMVGEASNGRDALRMVGELQPDILVIDIGMPGLNGIEATRQIVAENPDVKVVALSMHQDRQYVLAMLDAGAWGYVLKQSAGDELLRAIRAVTRNQKYLSPDVAGFVVDSYVGRLFPEDSANYVLGAREREVLQLLAEGKTSKQIAADLHIAVSTVEAHRRNMMKKLDIHSVAELTKYALRQGITSLER